MNRRAAAHAADPLLCQPQRCHGLACREPRAQLPHPHRWQISCPDLGVNKAVSGVTYNVTAGPGTKYAIDTRGAAPSLFTGGVASVNCTVSLQVTNAAGVLAATDTPVQLQVIGGVHA